MGRRVDRRLVPITLTMQEDNGTQERRIRTFRERGDRQREERREEDITVDVLTAGGNMQPDKVNGPEGEL